MNNAQIIFRDKSLIKDIKKISVENTTFIYGTS